MLQSSLYLIMLKFTWENHIDLVILISFIYVLSSEIVLDD
jgi:hypothetical protein